MQAWDLVFDIVLVLGVATILGAGFASLRQSAILGYMLAGTLLGPNVLHMIETEGQVEAIAELGVALLLFSLGLEFSWKRLRGLGTRALLIGVAQVIVTGAVVAAVAAPFVSGWREAVVVGAMVALSSTACTLRVLQDRTELETVHGRHALGILLVQDMAVVPLALVVALIADGGSAQLAADGGGSSAGGTAGIVWDVGKTLLLAVALVIVLFVVLNRAGVHLLRSKTLVQNRELGVLLAIAMGLGSAWSAHALDLSPALGAFVAGLILGASPLAAQIRADIASLRIVLLTLFFATVGMLADPIFVLKNAPAVAAVTLGLIIGKALLIWVIMKPLGFTPGRAIATGLCLAQVGEFAFVLGSLARGKVLSEPTLMTIGSAAILTLFLTPYLIAAAPRLSLWIDRHRPASLRDAGVDKTRPPDVLVIGFGPAGQQVGSALTSPDCFVRVIDLNPHSVAAAEQLGLDYQVGDALQRDVLEHAGVTAAKVVVVTLPAPATVREVVNLVRDLAPETPLIVRARYHRYRSDLESLGAYAVVDEEQQVGRQLAQQVREHLPADQEGASHDTAKQRVRP